MKILIAGTFDNFHIGHQNLCWRAYERMSNVECGRSNLDNNAQLVIIVARDKTVKKIKGKLPRNSEKQRLARVQAEFTGFENVVVRLGRVDGDFMATLKMVDPDTILLGYDQQFDVKKAACVFPQIKIFRAEPYAPEFFKSSKF